MRQHKSKRLNYELLGDLVSSDGSGSGVDANSVGGTLPISITKDTELLGYLHNNTGLQGVLPAPVIWYPYNGTDINESKVGFSLPYPNPIDTSKYDYKRVLIMYSTTSNFATGTTTVITSDMVKSFITVSWSPNTTYYLKARYYWNGKVSPWSSTITFTTDSNIAKIDSGGYERHTYTAISNPIIFKKYPPSITGTTHTHTKTDMAIIDIETNIPIMNTTLLGDNRYTLYTTINAPGKHFIVATEDNTEYERGDTINTSIQMSPYGMSNYSLGELPTYLKDVDIAYSSYSDMVYITSGATEVDTGSNNGAPLDAYYAKVLEVNPNTGAVGRPVIQINYDIGKAAIACSGKYILVKTGIDNIVYIKDIEQSHLGVSTSPTVPNFDSTVTNLRMTTLENGTVYAVGIKGNTLYTWKLFPSPITQLNTTPISGKFEITNRRNSIILIQHEDSSGPINPKCFVFEHSTGVWVEKSAQPTISPYIPYRLLTTTTDEVYTVTDPDTNTRRISVYDSYSSNWGNININVTDRTNVPLIGTGAYTTTGDNSVAVLEWDSTPNSNRRNPFYRQYM